jgi:hypothetical protein
MPDYVGRRGTPGFHKYFIEFWWLNRKIENKNIIYIEGWDSHKQLLLTHLHQNKNKKIKRKKKKQRFGLS